MSQYNVVSYNTILHTACWLQRRKFDLILSSQDTPNLTNTSQIGEVSFKCFEGTDFTRMDNTGGDNKVHGQVLITQIATIILFDSLRPSGAYKRQYTRSRLVQIMACHQDIIWISSGLLSIPPKEHISMEYQSKFKHFHWRECTRICCLPKVGHFVSVSMRWKWYYTHASFHMHMISNSWYNPHT